MELKFRVYSRSASKKRWNEKWKLRLVSGDEFHVTNQHLKIPVDDPSARTDIICAFYIQDGSLYFQMRNEDRTALINGVARPDAVVGKGDRIAIDEFAEILILQAPQSSVDGPTLTDVGGQDDGDDPTLAMEVTSTQGVSVDPPIDQSPVMSTADLSEIPHLPEPTTFMSSKKPESPLHTAPDADDDSIPDIEADRPEMTRAGLRSLLESTKTTTAQSIDDSTDADQTPPMGIRKAEDLPFESVGDPLQAVSEETRKLNKKPDRPMSLDPTLTQSQQKTKIVAAKSVNRVDQKTLTHVTTSFPVGTSEEKIELEHSSVTDVGIQEDAIGGSHVPPKKEKSSKKSSKADSSDITKSLLRIGEKASELTGAITKRLKTFSATLTSTKTEQSEKPFKSKKSKKPIQSAPEPLDLTGTETQLDEGIDPYGTPPTIDPATAPGKKTKRPHPIEDDVTGDGIVVMKKPLPHPTEFAKRDEVTKSTPKRSFPTKAIFFLGGLSLSVFAFFLVYVLLKPEERTPVQMINRPANPGTTVITITSGGSAGASGGVAGTASQPNAQSNTTVTVNSGTQTVVKTAPAVGVTATQGATPVPVFKNSANPVVQAGANTTANTKPQSTTPTQEVVSPGYSRGIPIEVLIQKVQRLRMAPSSSAVAPATGRNTQGSSR